MRRGGQTRRGFLSGAMAAVAGCCTWKARERLSLENVFEHYTDDVTGARVCNLTPGEARNQVVYQTHPMWMAGMRHLLFQSDRSGDGLRPHALDMDAGEVRPVLDTACDSYTKTWRSDDLYFLHNRELSVVNVVEAFQDLGKPRAIAALPTECLKVCGTVTVDADESAFYAGAMFEEGKRWGILALDLGTATWRTVVEVDFQVGHLQANPVKAGEIMFCHETGGDAPQRTWFVQTDGTDLRPFYRETFDEWVTHEVWWGQDRAVFTVWPYDDAHRRLPHGLACADRRFGPQGEMEVLAQFPAWHAHGSPDGRRAIADDMQGNLWIVDAAAKDRRLLSQGHRTKGFNTHLHPSFTPDSRAVVFNSSRSSAEDIFLVEIPDWQSLPPA